MFRCLLVQQFAAALILLRDLTGFLYNRRLLESTIVFPRPDFY
jgi:hypothetical protein